MFDFIYSIPDLYLFLIISISTITCSMAVIHLVRKYVPLDMRFRDNAMLGNMANLISIVYGVLVGLTALTLINNIATASDAVQREANAAADFYRDTYWLNGPVQQSIQSDVRKYLDIVINKEWPEVGSGRPINHAGDDLIDDMARQLHDFSHDLTSETAIMNDMLGDVKNLYDARQERIQIGFTTLNPAIWAVVLIGTILMIFICCFYSMNYYLHLVTMCSICIMLAAMIYLLISLDRPYQGTFSVGPGALINVHNEIVKHQAAQI